MDNLKKNEIMIYNQVYAHNSKSNILIDISIYIHLFHGNNTITFLINYTNAEK